MVTSPNVSSELGCIIDYNLLTVVTCKYVNEKESMNVHGLFYIERKGTKLVLWKGF